MLQRLRGLGFEVLAKNHAEAILLHDFPYELRDLVAALETFTLPVSELIGSGGGEARSTQRLRHTLNRAGWAKHEFAVTLVVDGDARPAVTHEIDHVRRASNGTLALEIEWNNKDPFFDRDLENFQRLHAQSVISVGMIVTRGRSLHEGMAQSIEGFLRTNAICSPDDLAAYGMKRRTDRQMAALDRLTSGGVDFAHAFAKTFVADKFGEATTHWRKLADRVARGVGNPCPLLLIGLPLSVVSIRRRHCQNCKNRYPSPVGSRRAPGFPRPSSLCAPPGRIAPDRDRDCRSR